MFPNLLTQIEKQGQGEWSESISRSLAELKENNFVSRIWAKDPSLWKNEPEHQKIISNSLGWLFVAELMSGKVKELVNCAEEVKREGFCDVVLLGMGGSSLAAEVFRSFLPVKEGYPRLHVLDSTDPGWVDSVEKSIRIEKTLFIVSSKSGTTIEPLCFYNYFFDRARRNGRQFVAVTDPGSYMERVAQDMAFRKIFINPSDIGGRFSALSYFGLVPAALSGVDVQKLLESATGMMHSCSFSGATEENPGVQLGIVLGEFAKMGRDKVTLILPKELETFALWIEQLIAESSGKEGKGLVPIAGEVLAEPALYGKDRLFVYIYQKSGIDKSMENKVNALQKKRHPVVRIEIEEPLELGAELFRWEFATAVACSLLGVNAFDQPGVQASKDRTKSLLKELGATGRIPTLPIHFKEKNIEASFSQAVLKTDPSHSLAGVLNQIKEGDYIGLLAYLPNASEIDDEIKKLRAILFDKTRAPILFGYGPRYLHSTGQLHKGGPNKGVFIVLTSKTKKDIKVPEQEFSFGQLELAQAIGDFQALDSMDRRAVQVSLQGPIPESIGALARCLSSGVKKERKQKEPLPPKGRKKG